MKPDVEIFFGDPSELIKKQNKQLLQVRQFFILNQFIIIVCLVLTNYCYKTRSCLDLKKQKERKEEKKKETEVNTSSSQLKMKS